MKKITILWLILDMIFLVVFNAVFFLLGGMSHTVTEWSMYVFIHFAYIMLFLTPFLVKHARDTTVFSLTLNTTAVIYFFITFFVGLIFILFWKNSWEIPFIVQLVTAGLYAVLIIINMILNEHNIGKGTKAQLDPVYIRAAADELSAITNDIKIELLKTRAEKVNDTANAFSAKPFAGAAELDSKILLETGALRLAVQIDNELKISDQLDILQSLLEERNKQ